MSSGASARTSTRSSPTRARSRKALDDAKARLDELRKAQAASEARVALFQDFERRFKPLIDGGQLRIETRRGQLVMVVQGDFLFDAGRTRGPRAREGRAHGDRADAAARVAASAAAPRRRYLVTANLDAPGDGQAQPVADAKARQRGAVARVAELRKAPHRTRRGSSPPSRRSRSWSTSSRSGCRPTTPDGGGRRVVRSASSRTTTPPGARKNRRVEIACCRPPTRRSPRSSGLSPTFGTM